MHSVETDNQNTEVLLQRRNSTDNGNSYKINICHRKSVTSQSQLNFAHKLNVEEPNINTSSVGRFSPQLTGKLTISPLAKCAESIPPPSPAPSNENFAADPNEAKSISRNCNTSQAKQLHILSKNQLYPLSSSNSTSSLCINSNSNTNSGFVKCEKNFSTINKNIIISRYFVGCSQMASSPNSRYRLDRYREPQQPHKLKVLEKINLSSPSPSTRLLLPSHGTVPLVQCDTYGYLASTVHTPVKRYVPTPPLTSNLYADFELPTASTNNISATAQYVNTMTYNYRANCCNTETTDARASFSSSPQTFNIATTHGSGHMPGMSMKGLCNTGRPSQNSISFHSSTIGEQFENTVCSNNSRSTTSDEGASLKADVNSGTCLHCNTARRTTGVHQTTQTTGPISPVPVTQQQLKLSNENLSNQTHCVSNSTYDHTNVTMCPSTIEANVLSLSPMSQIQCNKITENNVTYHCQNLCHGNQHQLHNTQSRATTNSPRQQQSQTNLMHHIHTQPQQPIPSLSLQQPSHRYSCKKRIIFYIKKRISKFFGVEKTSEIDDYVLWNGRHHRFAVRRYGVPHSEIEFNQIMNRDCSDQRFNEVNSSNSQFHQNCYAQDRPDILPVQDSQGIDIGINVRRQQHYHSSNYGDYIERKTSVIHMLVTCIWCMVHFFNKRSIYGIRRRQWSRSFAPAHVSRATNENAELESESGISEILSAIIEDEVFFDSSCQISSTNYNGGTGLPAEENNEELRQGDKVTSRATGLGVGVYIGDRHHGWRTSTVNSVNHDILVTDPNSRINIALPANISTLRATNLRRGNRIMSQILDGVLENSRRPPVRRIKYYSINELDDRSDHRPYFTYWINTVQVVVLILSIVCYGIAPIGFGSEQKTGQVLVTSLSLQTVQHLEQRNFWIGPRNNDLVHLGAKFAACMRRDTKIIDVVTKTRRQERETACCIRNDDSGCVQSSQADCSIRGLYPTKSISTWKKWSPGESGPGGRISGSVCGLDPKFCDAPASIAPYEWPDDITKWPICRKTNSFSQRYRYKEHTAEHMVCEVIGHPCCTGVYGECRITTREYCDFVNGYFHEEASLCSQISCLSNVCGMFPFFSVEIPDQLYRLLTSLCMHAGILHLAITLIFQHWFLADLERLIGTVRTAIVYIGSGLAGNLTSAVLLPHRPEVGPSASLGGVISSLAALLILMHWKHVHKPHIALFKLLVLCTVIFGIGPLPYQLNFAGLFAGVASGAFLTISLVPFTCFTKYGRKRKINLIWTCLLFHVFVYTTLLATFYILPSEFNTYNFGDVFSNSYTTATNTNIANTAGDAITSSQIYSQMQKPKFYYQDQSYSGNFLRNSPVFNGGTEITVSGANSFISRTSEYEERKTFNGLQWNDENNANLSIKYLVNRSNHGSKNGSINQVTEKNQISISSHLAYTTTTFINQYANKTNGLKFRVH